MKLNYLIIAGASLFITGLVSTLFGFAGSSIVGTFWGWFWVSALIQFIGFIAYNSYLIQKDDIALQKTEIEALDKLSKFVVALGCSYCQQVNNTPIQLNRKNTFKCDSCNQVNGVMMQFVATTLTTPIQSVKLPIDEEVIEFKTNLK